jgi:hypothetical protein
MKIIKRATALGCFYRSFIASSLGMTTKVSSLPRTEADKRFILQIRIDLADGSHQEIISDRQWRSHEGPITACGIYSGETYDARKELSGWSTFGFDDKDTALHFFLELRQLFRGWNSEPQSQSP